MIFIDRATHLHVDRCHGHVGFAQDEQLYGGTPNCNPACGTAILVVGSYAVHVLASRGSYMYMYMMYVHEVGIYIIYI